MCLRIRLSSSLRTTAPVLAIRFLPMQPLLHAYQLYLFASVPYTSLPFFSQKRSVQHG